MTLFKQLGNKRGIAAALTQWAGTLFASQAEPTRVDPLLQEGFALQQEVGDQEGIATSSLLLGWVALTQDDLATARTRGEEGLALYRKMAHREGSAEALALLGRVMAVRGDHAGARTLYEESLVIAGEIGDKEWLASASQVWHASSPCKENLPGRCGFGGGPKRCATRLVPPCSLSNEQTMSRPWRLYATISARAPLSRHGPRGVR